MATTPPIIFDSNRRIAHRKRMFALQRRENAAHYLLDEMAEDALDRLAFLRHDYSRSLVIGDYLQALTPRLNGEVINADPAGQADFALDEERPYPESGFDLIVSLGTLDSVNDLPGALVHMRNALAPGGLMISSFIGSGSLPRLRAALLEADGDFPAARLHPMVDVRAGGQLLQRTGWKNPVVDCVPLTVRFSSLNSLVTDLRAQGLTNALASAPPPLSRQKWEKAQTAFLGQADEDGRVSERFEVLSLSGWRPPALG